jgi:hypothetical protein
VLDGSGLVRRSEVFAGNATEGDTLAGMLKGLEAPSAALIVMDRGVATEENLQWLRESGYRYLVVSRERIRQFDPSQARALETATGQTVHLQEVLSEDGQEVRLYCHSAERAKKEEGISGRFVERFEAGLQKLADGLAKPRGEKRIAKLWERIGRAPSKAAMASPSIDLLEIMAAEDGQSAAQLIWERVPVQGTALTHPGVYCLRSSETDWDEERLWRTYMILTALSGSVPLAQVGAGPASDLSPNRRAHRGPPFHQRPRIPVCPSHPPPPQRARHHRALAHSTRALGRPVSGHCYAPPCRWTHSACA